MYALAHPHHSPLGDVNGAGFDEVSLALLRPVLAFVDPAARLGVVILVGVAVGQEINGEVVLEMFGWMP
jgi:hypothetical protein